MEVKSPKPPRLTMNMKPDGKSRMKQYAPYLRMLFRVKETIQRTLIQKHQIYCQAGELGNSAVIKLQKNSWTDDGFEQGVFFSVWVGEKELKKNRFNYNIHALKLRLRKGYAIKPREFASSFRTRLKASNVQWPHLRTDYGPLTLMQGWVDLDIKTFEQDVLKLLDDFVGIHGIIDEMLDEKKHPLR